MATENERRFGGDVASRQEHGRFQGGALVHYSARIRRRQTLQVNQATHVVGEILETYPRPCPYKPDAANQSPAHVVMLRPEDVFHPCPKPATTLVAHFLPITQRMVARSLAMNPTRQTLGLHRGFNGFGPVGAVRPHTACRVVRRKCGTCLCERA